MLVLLHISNLLCCLLLPLSSPTAKDRLASYGSPARPASPSERDHSLMNLNAKLNSAEKRREQHHRNQQRSPQQRAQRFSLKQHEMRAEKREASEKLAQRMADAENRRQELQNQKMQRGGGRYSRAKELSSAKKAAKSQEYTSKVSQIQLQQQAADERREQYLNQRKQKAGSLNRRVFDHQNEQRNKIKQKRFAMEQKHADAAARRNVAETYKTSQAYASGQNTHGQHSKPGEVIEIPVERSASAGSPNDRVR